MGCIVDVVDVCEQAPDDFRKHILFILAYSRDGALVGGTFNVVSGSHFHGRYWGAFDFYKNLHFEACYYRCSPLPRITLRTALVLLMIFAVRC